MVAEAGKLVFESAMTQAKRLVLEAKEATATKL